MLDYLSQRTYWFHTYFPIELTRSVGKQREHIRDRVGAFAAGHASRCITDVAIWPSPDAAENHRYLRCTDAWMRVARACSLEKLHFWLPLAGSGSTIHYFPPEVLDAINNDKAVAPWFLGIFAFEQPTPSLARGDHFDLKYFFNKTHAQFPNGVCDFPNEHWTLPREQQLMAEFEPRYGGILEPLTEPIANPVEALLAARSIYHRWADPYLKKLREGQVLNLLSWVSANRWFHCGFDGIKQAMSLYPFDRLNMMVEVNNDEMSIAYAQARGVSHVTGGVPWGTMVGGVRWKYWNQYLRDTGREHASPVDYNNYGKSPNVPPWLFFIPMAMAWAGGARQFSFEANAEQVGASPEIRAAIKSFYDFLDAAGEPFDPLVNVALLKGNGYFAWDMPPEYADNGMADEINAHSRYYNGRNATNPGTGSSPITEAFYPRTLNTREWDDNIFSGNPNGEIDLLPATASEVILKQYRKVIVFEWNCLDDATLRKLLAYVRSGGTLLLSAGQLLSKSHGTIDWRSPSAGDFHRYASELTGATFRGGASNDPHLYNVKLAGAKVETRAENGRPICIGHRVGKGKVFTFCGPSYRASLGDSMPDVFAKIARDNQGDLPYAISGISDNESKDLAVFVDRGSSRVAMVNYWHRFDMKPCIVLRSVQGKRRGERVVVHDTCGLVADIIMPPRTIPRAGSEATLLSQNIALLSYARTPAGRFSVTHVVPNFDLLAHHDVTLTYGAVKLKISKRKSPHWPEKERQVTIEIAGLPRGRWKVSSRIDGDSSRNELRAVDRDGVLRLLPGYLGSIRARQRISITGMKRTA